MDSVDKINKLKEHTMNLIKACLVFDFIGSSIDEFVDDIGTVQVFFFFFSLLSFFLIISLFSFFFFSHFFSQFFSQFFWFFYFIFFIKNFNYHLKWKVPTSWRTIFEDPTTVKLFWDSYMSFSPPHSGLVMECLVQMASVRRSLFQEAEREIYLSSILQGVYTVLDSSIVTFSFSLIFLSFFLFFFFFFWFLIFDFWFLIFDFWFWFSFSFLFFFFLFFFFFETKFY